MEIIKIIGLSLGSIAILFVLTKSNPISPTDKILSSNKMELMWTNSNNFKTNFLKSLIDMIKDVSNAKEINLINVREKLLAIDNKLKTSNVFYIHFIMKNKKKFSMILTSKQENHNIEHKLGTKLNMKLVDKILKLININIAN